MAKVSVLLVDDQRPFRVAAKAVIDRLDYFEMVGEASGGEEAVYLAEKLRPALVLMDVGMPVVDGIEATRRIVIANPRVVVFLCSTHALADLRADASSSGARGYLYKEHFGADKLRHLWDHRDSGMFVCS